MPKPPTWNNLTALTALGLMSLLSVFGCNGAQAEPLKGFLEHDERLPPVSPLLKPGVRFDGSAEQPQSNIWVKVPYWMAGTWLVNEETAVFRENYLTGQKSDEPHTFSARSKFFYGKQQDRQGQIWHYVGVPYKSSTQLSDKLEYHEVTSKEISQQDHDHAVVKTRVRVIRVNKGTEQIIETYQQESLTRYTDVSDGTMKLESSNKVFDAGGNPVSITNNQARIHRSAAFSPVDEENGKNLKELFAQFLSAQGMSDLIPYN